MASLLRKDNLFESCYYNLWNVMTKIALKINCRDSNPPVLAEKLPLWRIFPASCFRLSNDQHKR